jgi:hypothetical protein
MASTRHNLKTWPIFWEAVAAGDKTFEVRRDDDRQFQKGDMLHLLEFDPTDESEPGGYTGRELEFQVTYVLRGGQFGIEPGFVVLGLGHQITDCAAP